MATDKGKENIADGLFATAPSPKKTAKSTKKTRSKSIGPGGLGALEEPPLKESSGNRRKSAFVPAVKSILSSNDEDEKKRREARRKSLVKRRVSFAPEATLHTWDVVEYLRDATTSSASSDATRRASSASHASSNPATAPDSDAEPPSTPPELVEEPEPEPGSSPANQRDLHQKKNRRRSSGIPPMNFNNLDDVYSSSPLSGDNASPNGIHNLASDEDEKLAEADGSPASMDDSESSARLDAALRQAAMQAGTQRLDFDDDNNGDMSMVMAEDEITASFKPWAQKKAFSDQEQDDPFSHSPPSDADIQGEDEDMSMDITRAVGRIVAQPPSSSPASDDMSMELTMPLGSIQSIGAKEGVNRRKSLKRRASVVDASQGSPAKRPASRRASLRQRAQDESPSQDDQTMEFTMAIGTIKSHKLSKTEPAAESRTDTDDLSADETMDFTVAVGSIKASGKDNLATQDSEPEDEDLSMEFTSVVGPGIKHLSNSAVTPEKIASVAKRPTPRTKTPTPRKSPKKSPGGSVPRPSPRVQPVKATPTRSSGRRALRNSNVAEPQPAPLQQDTKEFELSPFVRSTPQSAYSAAPELFTPTGQPQQAPLHVPDDPIAAPILSRRRSSLSAVQFSPLAVARDEPTLRSTTILSNNIKLLSTPRKQTLASPIKRGITPKKSQTPQKEPTPKQKTPTPKKATPRKSLSPKKRVAFGENLEEENAADESIAESATEVERISLQEFLELTRIRFMDLSTTKRRHTAAPAAFHDKEIKETEESLDQYVVAGACTLPEFELYQHACHEMKKYISDGRHFVRTMETNVLEENPLLFSEYLTAPPDQRIIMDNQFKNLKTNARLEARGEWYSWRSTLLQDLKTGLLGTMDGFRRDEINLTNQEKLLDTVVPPLLKKHEELALECKQLQQRHDELNSCDREELEEARDQLVAFNAELGEKRMLFRQLQEELAAKEARIEDIKERKLECVAEIKSAERVREECRGWSTTEVNELQTKVAALEQAHGWSITSASSNMITMTHKNDLELYFQPSAFATGSNTPNASISLTYVGDGATPHSRPLTTSKRFFLQLIRAHLHSIAQAQTQVSELLSLVKSAWATALTVAEGVRWLEHTYITDEYILSDERMAISTNLILPAVQTKIRITFDIGVSLGAGGMETEVGAKAELVYGEKYSQEKMGAFLRDFCGNRVKEDMTVWSCAVLDLAERLRRTGVKGERV